PWQQVTLNAAVADAIRDLIGRAAIPLWSMEQVLHVAGCKVGNAPRTNFSSRAQIFKRFHDAREVSDPISPVQQIKIEVIGTETGEAGLARTRDTVVRHMSWQHLGDQEYVIALASYHAANQFLRVAVAVCLCRVDQRHPERKARTQ